MCEIARFWWSSGPRTSDREGLDQMARVFTINVCNASEAHGLQLSWTEYLESPSATQDISILVA